MSTDSFKTSSKGAEGLTWSKTPLIYLIESYPTLGGTERQQMIWPIHTLGGRDREAREIGLVSWGPHVYVFLDSLALLSCLLKGTETNIDIAPPQRCISPLAPAEGSRTGLSSLLPFLSIP